MGNRGGGGAGDFGNGGGGGWDRRPGGMQQGGGPMDKQEATFTIPAAKCGIVIGRGNYCSHFQFRIVQYYHKSSGVFLKEVSVVFYPLFQQIVVFAV
jgi:hypothetical protein